LDENGVLQGEYSGKVQIHLFDNVGNEAVYDVDLDS